MPINENTSVNELLAEAQRLLLGVPSGRAFCVRQLFPGHTWSAIPQRNRIRLGNLFFAYAEGEGSALVDIRTEQNKYGQRYVRK